MHRSRLSRRPIYPNATASRLEQSSTKLAVVRARNPLETMSWLRMGHLPQGCSSEFIKAFQISVRNTKPCIGHPAVPRPPDVQNSGPVTIAFKCMSQENACAHQAHHRCNRLDHRTSPYAPLHAQNDSTLAQSKRFTGGSVDRLGVMICCNRLRDRGTIHDVFCRIPIAYARKSTDRRSNDSFTTQRQIVHHDDALPISAAFRLRYLHQVMRGGPHLWGSGHCAST